MSALVQAFRALDPRRGAVAAVATVNRRGTSRSKPIRPFVPIAGAAFGFRSPFVDRSAPAPRPTVADRITFACLSLIAALAAPLTACTAVPTAPAPDRSGEACDPAAFASFVGRERSVLLATTFTAPIRVIDPGEVVTQEFDPERVNFVIDGAGTVARVYCG